MTQLLTDEFIEKYPDFPEEMNELGKFVYYRTYSRWLPDKNRRETWKETCRRAVEYNVGLAPTEREEAEKLFNNMFHLRQFLSGRTLWVGGTEVSHKYPMSNFNCAFCVIDDFEAFKDLFYLLMVGTGFGFRILKSDVDQLPRVRTDVKLIHRAYKAVLPEFREDETSIVFEKGRAAIYVGDSKEGWVQALDHYFRILWDKDYRNIHTVEVVYNNVRPKGERLKTFGGTASGHESLKNMFAKINNVITTDKYAPKPVNGKLRPIHCLDIANIIGENVVVGGVRRTAEIALLDANDDETLNAKNDLTPDKFHRFMSNNSVYYREKPTREQMAKHFAILRDTGEPCFVNEAAASERRPNFQGVNPCVEILLDSRGLCNLTTINVMAFVKDGVLDREGLLEAQRLSARAGYRMTCVDLELYKWDRIQKRDRLCGVSVTGWKDSMEALGYGKIEEENLQYEMGEAARDAADKYADQLGMNRPLLVTAVKPEGTISQVAGGVSSGLHHTHSPYYIRRIRINAHDPLCQVAEALGWSVKPEVGQGVRSTDDNGAPFITPITTKVIEFPIATPVKRTKYEVSALEQLETYYAFQRNYTEHNSSNTISVKDDEWAAVEQNVYDNWDEMVAVSFLKLDGHVYDLAPYEAIDREEYERMKAEMKPFDPELLREYEDGFGDDFDLGTETCEGGACPIR